MRSRVANWRSQSVRLTRCAAHGIGITKDARSVVTGASNYHLTVRTIE